MRKKKKKLIGKQEYEFFRWGTLSPKDHPESTSREGKSNSFHIAPVRKGIYSFPKGYIETFLTGMGDVRKIPKNSDGRSFWLRMDDNSKRILSMEDVYVDSTIAFYNSSNSNLKPEAKRLLKRKGLRAKDLDYIFVGNKDDDEAWNDMKNYLIIFYPRAKKFKYSGPYIWHHLDKFYDKDGEEKNIIDPKDIIDRKGSWVKTTMKVWIKALHKITTIYRWQSYLDPFLGAGKIRHGNPHTFPNRFSKDEFEVFIEKLK